MTDEARARARWLYLATAALFVLGAWPLVLCDIPPLEDLPAHLATAVVIRHPDLYPGFVFHGYFKTNATLFLWLHAFGESELVLASKLFVALVVLAHAWVFPRLVMEVGGRARLLSGTLLSAPLVHNWFVAMGMLDFALGSALALGCVTLLVRQVRAPSVGRAFAIGVLGLCVWYAHAFALGLLSFVAIVELLRRRDGKTLRAIAPLAVAVIVAAVSAAFDVSHAGSPLTQAFVYRAPWETLYELWAKYAWAFTKAELASVVCFGVLVVACIRGRKIDAPFVSMTAGAALLAFVFAIPHEALGWGNVSIRALPFLYAVMLVRAPENPSRVVVGVLSACALACSIGLGFDYARLTRDFRELAAGEVVVPEQVDLMPMIFAPKGSSENTWALEHAWAAYVLAKHTSAPLLFAHLPGHPVGYRTQPLADEEPLRLGRELAAAPLAPDAARELSRVASRHPWILVWGDAPAGFSPSDHVVAFERGRLRIYGPP